MHVCVVGLALDLDSGRAKGVIPLYYLKDLEVYLLAVGQSALDCCLLQDKVRMWALLFSGSGLQDAVFH